jgi:predicted nuclease with TOPRIM domain
MDDVYEANGPKEFPLPKGQPLLIEEPSVQAAGEERGVKGFIERWKKEVLDKIQYLKESLEQANKDKEALSQELDHLQRELEGSKERNKALEGQLSETLDTFYTLLNDVSKALEE